MTTPRPQTIAYPAPNSRPQRRDLEPLAPHVIVLFGATGDLAKRKLLPGLAYLEESALAPDVRIVGTAMEDLTTEEFRALARSAVDELRHPRDGRRARGDGSPSGSPTCRRARGRRV